MNAVEVNSLTFAYDSGPALLRDISFSIPEGEVFVIAGQSGCGKTTLCRILCGVIPNSIKGHISGEVMISDRNTSDYISPAQAGLSQTALRAGMVFQDADSQIICTTVEDEIAFGLENFCTPADEIRRRVDELLAEFGFEVLRYANPAALSDGMKRLLTIAAVLATAPPILILDEPLSGLDDDARQLVLSVIKQQKRHNRTVVIVEHDLKTFAFADKWLLLRDGTVGLFGAPADIMPLESELIDLGVWA